MSFNMTREQIINCLKGCSFCIQEKNGWRNKNGDFPNRLVHSTANTRGSLYVADNYISATGHFKDLSRQVSETVHDNHECPIWENDSIKELITVISKIYH